MSRRGIGQRRRPTELECCVLGIVWEKGPCSAYVVRKEFLDSASSYWSGSAGAIYPLLDRLADGGYLRVEEHPWGTRTRKEFRVSAKGRRALARWVGPPLEPWTAAPAFDPIRTRMYFLEVIPREERLRFVDEAMENLRSQIAPLRVEQRVLDREPSSARALASLGTIHELEGRLRWLRVVRERMKRK